MYKVKISDTAGSETRQIYQYISSYSATVVGRHLVRLADTIESIGRDPLLWPYFFLTGAPYRAKLFLVGKTSFWIVYEVNGREQSVDILRIWNSKQDPENFDL